MSSTAVRRTPTVSVVVPTRGRAAHAAACARSVLRNEGLIELIVVDQSDDSETERALSSIRDPRLRYVRTSTRGASSGRNVGIELSRGTVIAFTDDDCRVASDWVPQLRRCFAMDPDAALLFGRVSVPAEIRRQGFAMGFEPQIREWRGRFPPPESGWGIAANIAVRREVLIQVGDFDPVLGPGAALLCGEEIDLCYRVLEAGLKVVHAREVEVDHLGVRTPGAETKALWNSYAVGTAAAIFKHVRLGDRRAVKLYVRHLGACLRTVSVNLLFGRRPTLIRYTLMFLSGTLRSCSFRVDRDRRRYVQQAGADPMPPNSHASVIGRPVGSPGGAE